MEISHFAPVLIPTLNRFEHFKRCVESLSQCNCAENTDLFIFLDYPLKEIEWEGYNQIEAYIKSINGFKIVNIIKRTKNFGAMKNYEEGMSEIFESFDRVIYTEDDNEFSPNFLEYINKGLDKFENYENVLSICGHRPIINIPKEYKFNYYYAKGFSAWGFGIWKEQYKKFNYSTKDLITYLRHKKYKKKLKFYHEDFYYTVLNKIRNNSFLYGDGAIALDLIKTDQYCIYPTISKVRNYGHDGSGVHGGNKLQDFCVNQEIDYEKAFDFDDDVPYVDYKIEKALRNYSKVSSIRKIKFFIKKLINKIIYKEL